MNSNNRSNVSVRRAACIACIACIARIARTARKPLACTLLGGAALSFWLAGACVHRDDASGAHDAADVRPDPAHNLLKTSDFSDGIMLPWMTSFTPPARGTAQLRDGRMCLLVEEKGAQRWDAQLRHREMTVRQGHNYRLGFTASADRATRVTVKVGMSGPPYKDYFTKLLHVSPEEQRFAVEFRMRDPDDATVELAFHAGGAMIDGDEPVELCFDDVVLSDPTHQPVPRRTAPPPPSVRLNQLGFLADRKKLAIWVSKEEKPATFYVLNAGNERVFEGQSEVHGADAASGESVHLLDFSAYREPGEGWVVAVAGQKSDPFVIAKRLYGGLARDALRFFYHMRSGVPIEMPYAEDEKWVHPRGHHPDVARCAADIGCDYSLDVTGGWYDAGDHGKYVVNGGLSVWLLMNAVERARLRGEQDPLLGDGSLNVPESGNGVPDVLDEARFEMEFLLKMQVPEGKPLAGMAHHKMHDVQWTALGTAPHEDQQLRVLRPVSTAATLNLAAVGAQAARLFAKHDPAFAERCLNAAKRAFTAALEEPSRLAPPTDLGGGGPYDDDRVEDEFHWAAAELFLTTGDARYWQRVEKSPADAAIGEELLIDGQASSSALTWRRVGALGKISMAFGAVPEGRKASFVRASDRERYQQQLTTAADRLLLTTRHQGYRFPMRPGPDGNYPWGSNADVLGNLVLLAAAADFAKDDRFTDGVVAGMDYLLGRNALGRSYVTGYGVRPFENPHHRYFAHQANAEYPPPPPGFVAGGPNSDMQDPYVLAAGLKGCPLQKCYVDHIEAYSVNEVAINWNAATAWVTMWLNQEANR